MITSDWLFEGYVNVLSVVALIIVPIAGYCTWKSWEFARRYRPFRLPLVLAIVNTIAFPCALFIGYLAFNRLGGAAPVSWSPVVSATVFITLDGITLINTGYLIWLERKAGGEPQNLEVIHTMDKVEKEEEEAS